MVLLFTAIWSVGVAAPVLGEDTYHGRVVDEATDQRLVGAAVTVIWFRSPILGLESTRDFHSAQETATDSEGKFSLSVSPGIDWNPFTYIRNEPQIVIYQPGYEPTWAGWRVRNKYNTVTDLAEALKKGLTIKLRKLKTKEELIKFTNISSLTHVTVRYEKIPTLIHAVNVQNKIVGLKPYPAQGGKDP
jgi:hypothetical protein